MFLGSWIKQGSTRYTLPPLMPFPLQLLTIDTNTHVHSVAADSHNQIHLLSITAHLISFFPVRLPASPPLSNCKWSVACKAAVWKKSPPQRVDRQVFYFSLSACSEKHAQMKGSLKKNSTKS